MHADVHLTRPKATQGAALLMTSPNTHPPYRGPTLPNIQYRHSSFKGFFDAHRLDILCIQARVWGHCWRTRRVLGQHTIYPHPALPHQHPQEAKLPEDKLTKELACVEGFQSYWACSQEKRGYSGVTTWARAPPWAPLAVQIDGGEYGGPEGRVLETDHGAFVLTNVYVPNAGGSDKPRLAYKLAFLRALQRRADALTDAGREVRGPWPRHLAFWPFALPPTSWPARCCSPRARPPARQVIIVGDLNLAAEPRDVHSSYVFEDLFGAEERAAMAGLLRRYEDVWRRLHPDDTATYSFWDEKTSARPYNHGMRIDYVLASPGIAARVATCEVLGAEALPPKWSDHAGVLLELRGVEPPPPPRAPPPQWTKLQRRWVDPTQRSIMSMFSKKPAPKPAPAAAMAEDERAAAAEEAGDGPQSKRPCTAAAKEKQQVAG